MAYFLLVYQNIQHEKIVELIGGPDNINTRILKAYIALFNFKELHIIDAMRVIFSNFLMRGGIN